MIGIFEAAEELQRFCEGEGWGSCFIGGIAVLRWGEPRVTRDVDLTLMVGFGDEGRFVEALLKRFAGRLPDAHEFALRSRVLLLHWGRCRLRRWRWNERVIWSFRTAGSCGLVRRRICWL